MKFKIDKTLVMGFLCFFFVSLFLAAVSSTFVLSEVQLKWNPPTQYVDNSPIERISHFVLSLKELSSSSTKEYSFSNASARFSALASGKYGATVYAVSTFGIKSSASNYISFYISDGGIDSDEDGLNDLREKEIGTNPLLKDTDGDGVSDYQETIDQTNPLDSGSYLGAEIDKICVPWNGYLSDPLGRGMWNVFEHVHADTEDLQIETSVYDSLGNTRETYKFDLPTLGQRDLLIHDFGSRHKDAYGTVCSKATTRGNARVGKINGTMMYYKEDSIPGRFEFALAIPAKKGLRGTQYLPFNTVNPSGALRDSKNVLSSWAQITNETSDPQSGVLRFWRQDGNKIIDRSVHLEPKARFDVGLHEVGLNQVGFAEFVPSNSDSEFKIETTRFYYDNAWSNNSFESAVQFSSPSPIGEKVRAPFNSQTGNSIIELSNITDSNQVVAYVVYGLDGNIILDNQVSIPPKGTQHIDISSIAGRRRGVVQLVPSEVRSIVALVLDYERKDDGGFYFAATQEFSKPHGTSLSGSYNTYLNHKSELLVTNTGHSSITFSVTLNRLDGSEVIYLPNISLVAFETKIMFLNTYEASNQYGKVSISTEASDDVVAWITRERDKEYRITLPLQN